jgi:hypothetical protein
MNIRTTLISVGILGVALTASVATAVAQPNGRDSVYAAPGPSAATPAPAVVRSDLQPNGRDTVFASRIESSTPSSSGAAFVANDLQPNGRDTVSAARVDTGGRSSTTARAPTKPGG